MSVIGGITGNAKLARIGGFVALAGGIGSLATSLISSAGASVAGASADQAAIASAKSATAGSLRAESSLAGSGLSDAGTGASSTVSSTASGLASAGAPTGLSAATNYAGNAGVGLNGGLASTAGNFAQNAGVSALPTFTGGAAPAEFMKSINSTLGKYDNLLKIGTNMASGVGKGYEFYQANKIKKDRVANDARYVQIARDKFQNQVSNANAKFTLNLKYVPNSPGILYNGIRQRPIPTRKVM